jgi:hypothetical protein
MTDAIIAQAGAAMAAIVTGLGRVPPFNPFQKLIENVALSAK